MENSAPTRHLLLCATHRTGSNLLEQYLKAAQVAGRPREYYSLELSRDLAKKMGLADPDKEFLAYHRGIVERWRTANGVFAAKIMWRHLEAVRKRLAADPSGTALVKATAWETLLSLHPDPSVVHVTRRDKVRQAISMVRAKQTGVYSTVHLDYGRKQAVEPGEYDFHVIRYHVEKLTAEDEAWQALFKEHDIAAHTIVFEEFIKDPQTQTVALLKALELPEPETWHWPQVQIRPQSDATSAAWLERYREDEKIADKLIDQHREKRHRARKALEKQAAREARWQRWQKHRIGRCLIALERLCLPAKKIDPAEAKGDGVVRKNQSGVR